VSLFFLNACTSIFTDPYKNIISLADSHGFKQQLLSSDSFILFSLSRFKQPSSDSLTIYIEGDGYAWESRYKISNNPTPKELLTFNLATQDPSENILYLSRPCQFVLLSEQNCDLKFWTSHRYSSEVLSSYQQVINRLKDVYGFKRITLIGYSGGGVIAALLAANRNDVEQFVTIASNLDHHFWAKYHKITLLDGSLDTTDYVIPLSNIKQTHFVGAEDKIVPLQVVESYLHKLNTINQANYILVEGFSHQCCWNKQWGKRISSIFK